MSSEWPRITFIDLMEQNILLIGDGYRAKNSELGGEGLIFLRSAHVKDTHVDFVGVERFHLGAEEKLRQKKAVVGDVMVTTKGNSAGRTGFVTKDMPTFVYSPHLSFWRSLKPDMLAPGFLRAWSESEEFDNQLRAMCYSTDMAPYLSLTDQRRLVITLPPPKIQQAIAALNEALDDRITLLRETNATLEAIAQALFKSWFVDFDPVHAKQAGRTPEGMDEATAALFPDSFEETALGWVPRGWRRAELAEAFELNPARKLKKGEIARYLDMANIPTYGHCAGSVVLREMGSGAKFRNGDTLLARITPCLENGKSAFVDFLSDGETGWGSTEFVVLRPKPPLPMYFGYLLCRHPAFREFAIQSMSGTSGRQRVQNDVLGRYLLAVPTDRIAEAFADMVGPVQQSIAANHAQAQTLATLRDTLLPRLISGQLRLPEAERQIEAATA